MSDPKPSFVRVKIYDREYAIRTSGDPEQLRQLCLSLDKRMREVAEASGVVDTLKVALLAALCLADELSRTHAQLQKIDDTIGTRASVVSSLLDSFL